MIDPVSAMVAVLDGPSIDERREHAADTLVELVQDLVRDDICTAYLRIEGLSRDAWDEIDAPALSGWQKRIDLKTALGGRIVRIDLETDEGFVVEADS